jgi:hypothetical protein
MSVSAVSTMLGAIALTRTPKRPTSDAKPDQEADRRLRATIDREAGIDRNRADRRTSDDASRALLNHEAAERLEEIERPLEVQGHDAVEVLLGVLEDRFADINPRRSN